MHIIQKIYNDKEWVPVANVLYKLTLIELSAVSEHSYAVKRTVEISQLLVNHIL